MKPIPRVIDISHHNWEDQGGKLDFVAARKAGIWGVIHKATEHTTYVDPFYEQARAACERAGLLFGAYHFFRPEPLERQVEHFLGIAQPGPDTLLVLDHEDEDCSLESAKQFMLMIEERTGQRPAIYSGHLIKEQIGSKPDPYFSGSRLWLAQYGDDPEWPPQWNEMWLWQFTDGDVGPTPHTIPGIGSCDINSFSGTAEELEATWAEEADMPRPKPPRPPAPQPGGDHPWLDVMRAITGLTEGAGAADNPKILGMRDYIARKWPDMAEYCSYYKHDDTPWCGLCSAFCVSVANIRPPFGPTDTDRWMWALSWSDPKDAKGYVRLDQPQEGCIVITEREGGGHVTMFERMADNGVDYMCRGGNQSDMVNVAQISRSSVVGLMWPTDVVPEVDVNVTADQYNTWTQASLNILGAAPQLDVDGEFGPATQKAIRDFQQRTKLPPTGVADKGTVDAMLEELDSMNEERPAKD
jgi:lysozyme